VAVRVIGRLVVVAIAAAALAAGCTQTKAGEPSPSGATTATSNGPTVAPRVTNPRDARGLAPCSLLTAEQQATLGLEAEAREAPLPSPIGTGCQWTGDGNDWGVIYGFDTARNGLDELYQRKSAFQHFEPRTIDGYPAVDAQTVFNAEDCYTYVGIADTQVLLINVDNRPSGGHTVKPACERLDEIAKMIIGNLPPLK
jgi:Protein of unknown function (DUF3558)